MRIFALVLALLSGFASAATFTLKAVPTANAPGAITVDPVTGIAFAVGRVPDDRGSFTGTVISRDGSVIATVNLHGTPYYYGPYPLNHVTKQVIVPLSFSSRGATVDAISTRPPFKVSTIMIPNATNGTVAAVGGDGTTYVLAQETDGLHVVSIAVDGTQIDKFLFSNGTSSEVLLVNQNLYVVGSASNAGLYVVDTTSFSGTLNYTFIPGTYGNYLYSGTILAASDGNVYVACNASAKCSGVSVLNGTQLLATIPIAGVHTIGYSEALNMVYVTAANNGHGEIWQIQGTSLVSSIPITQSVGRYPLAIAPGPTGTNMYFVGGVGDNGVRSLITSDNSVRKIEQLRTNSNPYAVTTDRVNGAIHIPNNGGPEFQGQDLIVTLPAQ